MSLPDLGIGKVLDWAGLRKKYVYYFHEGSAEEKGKFSVDSNSQSYVLFLVDTTIRITWKQRCQFVRNVSPRTACSSRVCNFH